MAAVGRELGEIRVGDVIEFAGRPGDGGIITNMFDGSGAERKVCMLEDQPEVVAMVIHRARDGRYAVWQTENLPRDFLVTFRRRTN